MPASPLPSRGPKGGRKCCVTLAFAGIPDKGKQHLKWLPHPHLLRGPKVGRNATSRLHSRGSATKGNKIRSGCLTPAFSGDEKRADLGHHLCILGDSQRQAGGAKCEVAPQKGEQNHNCPPHPCLLGGRKESGNAMSPLHSRGSPTPSARSKIKKWSLTKAKRAD